MDLVRLEILLDIIAWVLDRRKHFGQIGLEYISMWLAALLNTIAYTFLGLVIKR